MSDAVLPRNISRGSGAAVTASRIPIVDSDIRASTGTVANTSTLSELQKSWLRPEFTEAMTEHLHRAKRLAILDRQE